MRIAVTEQAHATAVEALVGGNQLAAQTVMGLSDRLAPYAGMAGDDSTATEFATSYDDAAAGSVAAVGSLVGAFAALAGLVEASLANHAHAEATSVLPGWTTTHVAALTAVDQCHWVRVPDPPSSLGAQTEPPGGPAGLVLNFLQDVFWPNADTDRVRAAAGTWTATAEALDLLGTHCDSAGYALVDERSPEIPLALGVLADLRDRTSDLAAQLGDLATACTEYADAVDQRRHQLVELLEDLATELAAGALIAGGLTFLSGGTAAGLAGGAGAAKLATASTKARTILDTLRATTTATAAQTRPIATTAGDIGAHAQKIARARVMLMEAGGRPRRASLSLSAHEGPTRGHTLKKHVGKSDEQLLKRLQDEPEIPMSSSFADQATAERMVSEELARRSADVEAWLAGSRRRLILNDWGPGIAGRSAARDGIVSDVEGIRVVLQRDPTMPSGFTIKTAFPQP
ncbi:MULTISPECIES: RNase A-like domain-containing protein [unclassified Nocardioides]|uniref:RNase A-like domain-containing protein n=1 Tax=unclassified Nocardioides TaxID=2615069 RepID=UPI0036136DA7